MDAIESGGCEHGNHTGGCWYCLSQDDQTDNLAVWERVAQDPLFGPAMATAEEDIRNGRVIRLIRPEADGRPIVFTYTAFRQLIDIIHDDSKSKVE